MSELSQQNLEIGRRFTELWNARDPTAWDIFAPGMVGYIGHRTTNLEEQMRGEKYLLRKMPDCRREILREVAGDDYLIHHWRCSGHLESTGRAVEWEGCTWFRVEDGRWPEAWVFGDPSEPKLD